MGSIFVSTRLHMIFVKTMQQKYPLKRFWQTHNFSRKHDGSSHTMLPIILNFNQRNPVISNANSAIPSSGNIYNVCIRIKNQTEMINCLCFCSTCISVSPSFPSFPAVSDELCGPRTPAHTVWTAELLKLWHVLLGSLTCQTGSMDGQKLHNQLCACTAI